MIKYDWESEELFELRKIKSELIDIIWSNTKPNINHDDLIILYHKMTDRERFLVDRDSDINSEKVCNHCETNKIYICDPCMDVWSKELDDKLKETHDTIKSR
jgi:hypothetical protein